tara:strand:+ start:3380 stop:3604 length:225 start_codon:yes stop_codon:yes gene_type:complete
MSIEYRVEEWSVDTREWVINSPRKLTHEEVFEIYNGNFELDDKKFDGITVYFIGTKYGDDSQCEINGDFKEEEE